MIRPTFEIGSLQFRNQYVKAHKKLSSSWYSIRSNTYNKVYVRFLICCLRRIHRILKKWLLIIFLVSYVIFNFRWIFSILPRPILQKQTVWTRCNLGWFAASFSCLALSSNTQSFYFKWRSKRFANWQLLCKKTRLVLWTLPFSSPSP